jgi:hypothetical protein
MGAKAAPRRLASWLLHMVLRLAPQQGRQWARAMLCELDFVDGDWAALTWALGGATAMLRCAARNWRAWLRRDSRNEEGQPVKDIKQKAAGVAWGVAIASVFAVFAYGLLRVSFHYFPSLYVGRVPWVAWLVVIALPETAFAAGAVMLWRRQRPMALGILLSAMLLATHFAIHILNHWNG